MITLYKGDDTGGQLGKNVKIMFHCDDAVDMDDVVVKFDLLGIIKREFTDVHDGDILDIFISHAESRKFPLGVIFAKMWGEDASGKLRTFANRIPFRVTLNLFAVYGSDGTDSQDIHVYSSVDWDSIANKPTVYPSSVEEVEGLQDALDEINGKIPEEASANNQLADKEWVDQEIDRVAAYYITSDAQGNPFQTRAALLNAETYYSGGSPRTPTRNDYAIVLADESHDNTEWRYIYSENDQGVGVWEAQYPVEGAIVADDDVTKTSTNPVKSSGIWSAIWGALTAIPEGFTSLYDWVMSQLAGKRYEWDFSANTWVAQNPDDSTSVLAYDENQDIWFGRYDLKYHGNNIWVLSSADFDLTTNAPSDARNLTFANGSNTYKLTRASRIALDSEVAAALSLAESAEGDASIAAGIATRAASNIREHAADTTIHVTASEKATWNGKQNALTAQQLDNIAAVPGKANRAANPTAGNLAALDAQGNPTDSTIPAANVAVKSAIPYTLVTKTISNNAVTLDDRASNAVTISTTLSPNTLTINFPTAPTGKLRDFAMRLNIAAGVTAPEIAWPQGVMLENNDGEVPEIADGGTDGSSTILYFSETENNGTIAKFLVKSETLAAITQA